MRAVTGPTGAVLLALAVVLTGCTSAEPQPPALPPAPSVSPSVAPLPLPPEAAAETAEGASEFARFYMQVLGHAIQLADPQQVRMLSDSGCGGCQNLISAIEDERTKGQSVLGAEFKVLAAVLPAVTPDDDVIVDLRYERMPGQLLDREGRTIDSIAAELPIDSQMRLGRVGGQWIVLGFRAVTE